MSKVEQIERVIETLPPEDFDRLSAWMAQRQRSSQSEQPIRGGSTVRDHSAFLNSYTPEDEGLYDHAAGR